jgi:hypothetical protein
MKKTLTPKLSVEQTYDDNVGNRPVDTVSDWITVIWPGVSLGLDGPSTSLDLGYAAGFTYYLDNTRDDLVRHRANIRWDQDLSQHWGLHVSDVFTRSEDPIYVSEDMVEDVTQGTRIYNRNTGEARLSYAFGEEDEVRAGYRNRYVDDTSSLDNDSLGQWVFLDLDTWFTPRYGLGFESSYNQSEFTNRNDFNAYEGALTLNYRWRPTRTFYGRYRFLSQDFEHIETLPLNSDYQVHRGTLGVNLGLTPSTDLGIEGGYFVLEYEDGGQENGPAWNATLTTRKEKTTLRMATDGGYYGDFYSAEQNGSSLYADVNGLVDHSLTEHVGIFVGARYRWQEYLDLDRIDEVWWARAGLSYDFWRWFSLSLEGQHTERISEKPAREFTDNRATLILTWAYPHVF